jgi:hypothetical protein
MLGVSNVCYCSRPAFCCVTSDLIFDKGSECVLVLVLGGTWCGIGQDQKFRIVSIDFWLKLCYNRMGYFFFFFFLGQDLSAA